MGPAADAVFDAQGVGGPTVYQSERDDWILAMAAAGLGYAFMPSLSVDHPGVVARAGLARRPAEGGSMRRRRPSHRRDDGHRDRVFARRHDHDRGNRFGIRGEAEQKG